MLLYIGQSVPTHSQEVPVFNAEPGSPPTRLVITCETQITRLRTAAHQLLRLSGETEDRTTLRQYLMDNVLFSMIAEAAISTRHAVVLEFDDLLTKAVWIVGQLIGIHPGTKPIDDQLLNGLFCNAWGRAVSLL